MAKKEKFVPTPPAWTWREVDKAKVKREFLELDTVAIGREVRMHGPAAAEIVGGIVVAKAGTL